MAPPSFDLGLRRHAGAPAPSPAPGGPEPRAWQRRLIQLLRARLVAASPGGQDVLLHAGPGAGKTLGALLAFRQLQREGRLERLVVFCHRSAIGRQWVNAAARLGLDLREWDAPGGAPPSPAGHGLLLSYQAAALHRHRLARELGSLLAGGPWLAIADEVHHLGLDPLEPEATAWGHAFSSLSGAARRIRMHDQDGPAERIIPDLCVEPRALIAAGDVRPLEFRFQDGWVEHGRPEGGQDTETSPLSAEQRESWRARNLRRAIRPGDRGGIALRLLLQARRRLERVRLEHPGAGGLVVARDITHAGAIAELLAQEGDRVHLVHSQDPEAARRLAAFQAGDADWLVSIDMCAEGFDAPRLRVVAYLTTVVTRSRFVQAITRAVRMDGDRSCQESIPRRPSYVFAPADPLLIGYARGWTVSEPYVIRPRPPELAAAGNSAPGSGERLPLQALSDDAGRMISVGGPVLPNLGRRSA